MSRSLNRTQPLGGPGKFLAIPVLFSLLCPPHAFARDIALTCRVTIAVSGDPATEQTTRVLRIDPDKKLVRDGDMRWADGRTSPAAPTLKQFVDIRGPVIAWGQHDPHGGQDPNRFTLDTRTSDYSYAARYGVSGSGQCRPMDE